MGGDKGIFTQFGIILNKLPANPIRALYDASTSEFEEHSSWYNNTLPTLLDPYEEIIGKQRTPGTLRDLVAEFVGAADFGQRYKGSKEQAVYNSKVYQYLNHGFSENAQGNRIQDEAGLAFGMANKRMSKEDLIKHGISWAKKNYPKAPIDNTPDALLPSNRNTDTDIFNIY